MRRTTLLVALLLVAAGVFPLVDAPASADPAPCPPSFFPFPVPVAPGDQGIDRNGNGLVCFKPVPGRGNSVFEGFVVKDDKP